MANLVYYRNEKEVFKTAFEKKLSVNETEIVSKKLIRHCKLGEVHLAWTSGNRHPRARRLTWGSRQVLLNIDWNNFGILCHEFAHIRQIVKGNAGHNWHNKKHWRFMKGMIAYCERKNWFEAELKRRLAPKPIKPEPTKQEIQQQKILRVETKIKRYEMKIKMYGKKLVKAKRSLTIMHNKAVTF